MISVRLTGTHLVTGVRLEISFWIILTGCLKLQKFIIQGIYILCRCLGEGGGGFTVRVRE